MAGTLNRLKCLSLCSALSLSLMSLPLTVHAATPEATNSSQIKSFVPDFFKSYQPQNAMEMISHLPGFVFKQGQQGVRGFSGAAGNVLINSQRPTSKDQGLEEILRQIPASQVERIDVISGGAPGIDMQSQSQIANIIRKSSEKPSLQVKFEVDNFHHFTLMPQVSVNYSQKIKAFNLEANVAAYRFRDDSGIEGKRISSYPSTGATPLLTTSLNLPQGWGAQSNFKLEHEFAHGKLSGNIGFKPLFYKDDTRWVDTDIATEHIDLNRHPIEGGLEFRREITKTVSIDATYLGRRQAEIIRDNYYTTGFASAYSAFNQTGEDVGDFSLTYQPQTDLKYQIKLEKAYNFANSASSYTEDLTSVSVPASNVDVHEDRAEYTALINWKATQSLNIEAAMTVETSTIGVKQGNRQSHFVYPKPRFQIIWQLTPHLKLDARIEREVSQLDFGDFATSVDLQSTTIHAGNTQIVPSKQWTEALRLDYSFWDKGNFGIALEHNDIRDTIDHMILSDGVDQYDTRGNIGKARKDQLTLDLTLPYGYEGF